MTSPNPEGGPTVTAAWAVGEVRFETLRYAPGSVIPSYIHEGLNVCLVLTGGCVEVRDGARHHYRGPALTVNVPSTRQEFLIGPDGATCFSIDVPAGWLDEIADCADGSDREAPLGPRTARAVNVRDPIRISSVLGLRRAIEWADDLEPVTIEEALIGLLDGTPEEPSTAAAAPAWLRRVVERLDDEPATAPGLESLARDAGVHRVHLARSFRRYYGRTIGEHIRARRLWLAQNQMANDDAALGRVALRAGFYDQSHFNRWFKETSGMTPGEFRRLVVGS